MQSIVKASGRAVLVAFFLVAPGVASARTGAPIVFANRDGASASAQSVAQRPRGVASSAFSIPGPQSRQDAPVDEPNFLYGYGTARPKTQRVIDLRVNAPRARQEESLSEEAFESSGSDGNAAAPDSTAPVAPSRSMPDQSPPAPAARVIPAAAPTRPDWLEQERTGAPYEAMGQWYVPTAEPNYSEDGVASWYGDEFRGRRTSSGEPYDPEALTAAHPTLPIFSLVQITNLENGREVIVRITDRGPFHANRLIDVSRKAAEVLGFATAGQARVNVRYLGPSPKRVAVAPRAPGASTASPVAEAPATEAIRPSDQLPAAKPATGRSALARAPAGAFVIQAGAFSDPANAERARARLQPIGDVRIDARPDSALRRVRVGAFESRAEAESARLEVVRLGFSGAVVTVAE